MMTSSEPVSFNTGPGPRRLPTPARRLDVAFESAGLDTLVATVMPAVELTAGLRRKVSAFLTREPDSPHGRSSGGCSRWPVEE